MSNPTFSSNPPLRQITQGPKYHWFGYYDKNQFDPTGRFVLGMEVDFEHRSPRGDDVIKVGMVDLQDGDRWIELGESCAWGWQQGCMLQWLPGSQTEVIWNDRQDDHFVCHIMDIRTRVKRTLPGPVYTISSDGAFAFAPDFRRINHCRPGYGYAGIPDPNRNILAPADAGIWKLNLKTGQQDLILPLSEIVKLPYPHGDISDATHWFNHLLINPTDTRLEFLHRWRHPGQQGFDTRMLTVNTDGGDWHVIDDYGKMSHFIWRDPSHILAWASHPSHDEAFYLYEDLPQLKTADSVEVVGLGVMTHNGHCTYLPGNAWILNDAYPDSRSMQVLYIYHIASGTRVPLGEFLAPPDYRGEWRCDLHPRASRDGRTVCIDSAHTGGRQMFVLDLNGWI